MYSIQIVLMKGLYRFFYLFCISGGRRCCNITNHPQEVVLEGWPCLPLVPGLPVVPLCPSVLDVTMLWHRVCLGT